MKISWEITRFQIENEMKDFYIATVEVCPTWVERRSVFTEAIGGGDLSRPAMLWSEGDWEAATCFCEAVMLQKGGTRKGKNTSTRHPTPYAPAAAGDAQGIGYSGAI